MHSAGADSSINNIRRPGSVKVTPGDAVLFTSRGSSGVGKLDGNKDGTLEGRSKANKEGEAVGSRFGEEDGFRVGNGVGKLIDDFVGAEVGIVGAVVGLIVEYVVGVRVRNSVTVGSWVGGGGSISNQAAMTGPTVPSLSTASA